MHFSNLRAQRGCCCCCAATAQHPLRNTLPTSSLPLQGRGVNRCFMHPSAPVRAWQGRDGAGKMLLHFSTAIHSANSSTALLHSQLLPYSLSTEISFLAGWESPCAHPRARALLLWALGLCTVWGDAATAHTSKSELSELLSFAPLHRIWCANQMLQGWERHRLLLGQKVH